MIVLDQKKYSNPKYSKLLEWGRLISVTGGAQIIIQAMGLISGLLVIRLLPTNEYALYTLANTILGTMAVLADGGISTGVMAEGGKNWQDRIRLGKVLATGIALRNYFAIAGLLIAIPILIFMMRNQGISLASIILIIIALVPAFITTLSGTLVEIPSKLQQDLTPLQKTQVKVNAIRAGLLLLTLFVYPWAFIAILSAGLPQIWANIRIKTISNKYCDWRQKQSIAIRKEILKSVKRILPYSIYYCLSGQITIWLITLFGTTTSVAQAGALGRLAMILTIISTLFSTLIVPRYSRQVNNPKTLLNTYLKLILWLSLLCICIILFVWIFPSEVLWILGKKYSELKFELLLNIIGSCINLIAGASFTLCISRGFAINSAIAIPINILTLIGGAALLDISTLKGVLILNIITGIIQVILNVGYTIIKFNSVRIE